VSYTVNPAAMVGLGCFSRLVQRMFSSTPGESKRILRKKILEFEFSGGEEELVCDVEMLSSTFFS